MGMVHTMSAVTLCALGAAAAAAEDAGQLPDPTRPYTYRQAVDISSLANDKHAEWRLYGIQIRGDERRAIINGRLVKEKDQVGDATVVSISPTEVTIEQDHRSLVLRLLNTGLKHQIAGSSAGKNSEKD